MKNIMLASMLSLVLLVAFGQPVFAQGFNIVGDWAFTASYAWCDPAIETCDFAGMEGTFYIANQAGNLFYGYVETVGNHPFTEGLFTGHIYRGDLIINIGGDTDIRGKITRRDKMGFIFQNLDVFGRFASGGGIATRQQ